MGKVNRSRKDAGVLPVHIGKLLSEKIKEKKLNRTEIARSINRAHTAIKPLFNRPSIQAYFLWELSIALQYDFFSVLSDALLQKHPEVNSLHNNDKATIASLEKELADVKRERDNLVKMMNVLGSKIGE